ncbi:M23 family metallopeptidase [Bacillus alkalicellulosilyticus]|uniref:M23 family metallopeptidase n=1 Tax=Alkalihalobacterium alkalicellulosilyticum TaxID=1912214 RepID=UPI00099600CC|nr:M23 family metallopeptidase [Bacillus alkalicellulosilyticus]
MDKNLDKIRRKIDMRRREAHGTVKKKERSAPVFYERHDEARDEPDFYLFQDREEEKKEDFINKDWLMMRSLIAVVVFLVTAILFNNTATSLEGARQFIKTSFEQELKFDAIAGWYENQFGKPLALLPFTTEVALDDYEDYSPEMVYAVPASGVITENFQQNGRGVLVETGMNEGVEAVKSGVVIFVGEEDNLGMMVGIRHYDDGSESWYGMLSDVDVALYDPITSGHKIGTVSSNEEVEKGIYYFALKQGEKYVDPIDVISFE